MWLHAGGIGEADITSVIGQYLRISQVVAAQEEGASLVITR